METGVVRGFGLTAEPFVGVSLGAGCAVSGGAHQLRMSCPPNEAPACGRYVRRPFAFWFVPRSKPAGWRRSDMQGWLSETSAGGKGAAD